MKHIVIDARLLGTSTGRYIERLLHYLQLSDSSHRYSVLISPRDATIWQPTNKNFTAVLCPYAPFGISEQLGLKRQIESLQPDLVHFTMIQQPAFYRGKTVTSIHDLTTIRFRNSSRNWVTFTVMQQVYRWLTRRVARHSAALITPSEFVRQDIASYAHVSPSKITVTHEAVDDFDTPAHPIPQFVGKQFIVADGRPRPHKNLQRIIEAFAIVHQQHPDLYLMLVGKRDQSDQKFTALIESFDLSERAIRTDFIPDSQLKWALQNCKAYVYASLSEGFGLIPLEAMLNNAPVAASNATCLPEVCGNAAQYFDPYSPADMARAIQGIITDPARANTLRALGHKQVKKYSWQRMADQTLAVYKHVLGE